MTSQELQAAMARFTQAGGTVSQVAEGQRVTRTYSMRDDAVDDSLRGCTCGCHGNYTEHSMRLGESGRYHTNQE